MPRAFLLTYFTAPFSAAQRQSLLERLNKPNKEFDEDDVVEDVGVDAALVDGKPADEIVALHRELARARDWDLERVAYGALFLIVDAHTVEELQADEKAATVEVVLVTGAQDKRLRVRVGQAVSIWTGLDAGTCSWEDFERGAARTGVESGEGPGEQHGADRGSELKSKGNRVRVKARVKQRPAERVE